MEEHPIQGLMTTAMENLNNMVEANTIIGDPVESPDGSIIIPVSKLGFGFAAGGSEFNPSDSQGEDAKLPFGGGSGGGVSITPVAFLILGKAGIKMVHLDQQTHLYEKLLNNAPQVFEKIQEMLKESGFSLPMKNKQDEERRPRKEREEDKETKREKSDDNINYDI